MPNTSRVVKPGGDNAYNVPPEQRERFQTRQRISRYSENAPSILRTALRFG